MQTAKNCLKHLKLTIPFLIFISLKSYSQQVSLSHGFAHNDYWHKPPLFDALENGYTHMEADIYLRHRKLIVAHILPIFRRKKNLEQLYFKPLRDCINGKNMVVNCPAYPLMLMIDIKSDADDTYQQLETLLEKYKNMLSGYENGRFVQRQLTVVLTGHKPNKMLKAQVSRLAFMDEDLLKAGQDTLAKNVYQTASCKYSRLLKWNGEGQLPEVERKRLCGYVSLAHQFGKKVRLWASPENEAVWKELLNCGVDLINTDKLVALKNFLTADLKSYAKVD